MEQTKLFVSDVVDLYDTAGRRRELRGLERQMNDFLRDMDQFGWKREEFNAPKIEYIPGDKIFLRGSIIYSEKK